MEPPEFEWIGPAGPIARAVCRPQLEWLLESLRAEERPVAAVFEEVNRGHAHYGIVPIENTSLRSSIFAPPSCSGLM